MSQSTISRIETGKQSADEQQLAVINSHNGGT